MGLSVGRPTRLTDGRFVAAGFGFLVMVLVGRRDGFLVGLREGFFVGLREGFFVGLVVDVPQKSGFGAEWFAQILVLIHDH